MLHARARRPLRTDCAPTRRRAPSVDRVAARRYAANAALGRHQIEFVYDDYTLKAAAFPVGVDLDLDVDYNSQAAILDAVAQISTPVGFNDMKARRSIVMPHQSRAFCGLTSSPFTWQHRAFTKPLPNHLGRVLIVSTCPEGASIYVASSFVQTRRLSIPSRKRRRNAKICTRHHLDAMSSQLSDVSQPVATLLAARDANAVADAVVVTRKLT